MSFEIGPLPNLQPRVGPAARCTRARDRRLPGAARAGERAGRIQDQIDAANLRLDTKENRLKAQFPAIELPLQNSQAQQAWLTGHPAALNRTS